MQLLRASALLLVLLAASFVANTDAGYQHKMRCLCCADGDGEDDDDRKLQDVPDVPRPELYGGGDGDGDGDGEKAARGENIREKIREGRPDGEKTRPNKEKMLTGKRKKMMMQIRNRRCRVGQKMRQRARSVWKSDEMEEVREMFAEVMCAELLDEGVMTCEGFKASARCSSDSDSSE